MSVFHPFALSLVSFVLCWLFFRWAEFHRSLGCYDRKYEIPMNASVCCLILGVFLFIISLLLSLK